MILKTEPEERWYGIVRWSSEDLLEKRPWLTDKQVHEIMAHINKNLRERQIEYGWDVLAALCDQIEDEFPFLIKPRFQRLKDRTQRGNYRMTYEEKVWIRRKQTRQNKDGYGVTWEQLQAASGYKDFLRIE